VAALFIVLRAQIVRVILGAGAFTWTDTRLTAASMALLSISIVAEGLVLLLVRAFYAANKTREPLLINIISSLVTVLISLSFINIFHHYDGCKIFFDRVLRVQDVSGAVMLALPLSYSVGMFFNLFFLMLFFEKDFGGMIKTLKKSFWQNLMSAFVMGFSAYYFLRIFDGFFDDETFVGVFLRGFLSGIIAVVFGLVVLRLMKNEELKEVVCAARNKFGGEKIVASEPESLS
jgi:peptidoglycan biosynthesis protein MviN/MurJ (putative lipid II flippase)